MRKIYILKRQKLMFGPYNMDTIAKRGLKQTDLVWYEGLDDWTPALEIDSLQGHVKKNVSVKHLSFIQRLSRLIRK